MNFQDALKLATEAHEGQVRKYSGLPYIIHPIAVADKFEDEIDKIVAILHDVIEDTDITIDEIRYDYGLSLHGVRALNILTKRKEQNYFEYILSIKENRSIIALKVKIEDLKHNLSDLKDGCLRDKYLMALYILEG